MSLVRKFKMENRIARIKESKRKWRKYTRILTRNYHVSDPAQIYTVMHCWVFGAGREGHANGGRQGQKDDYGDICSFYRCQIVFMGCAEKSTKNAGTSRQYFALLRREGILDIF